MITRFDPAQPRDNNGRWTNGMPNTIANFSMNLGGLDSSVESRNNNRLSVSLGKAAASFDMDSGTPALIRALSHTSGSYTVDDDAGNPVFKVRYTPNTDVKTKHDATLEMVGQDVVAEVSHNELDQLRDAFILAKSARRVNLESGPVDVFVGKKTYNIRTTAGTMSFDPKSWERLREAENVVHEGFDEMGDYGEQGADVNELSVRTNEGKITILRHGDFSTDESTLITWGSESSDEWFVTHTAFYNDPWFQAVQELPSSDDMSEFAKKLSKFDNEDDEKSSSVAESRWSTVNAVFQRTAEIRSREVARRGDRPRHRRSDDRGARAMTRATLAGVHVRQAASGGLSFEGHASVTERGYEMWDFFGPYSEVVSARAFDDTLARAGLDVPLVLGHDQMRRLARTTNGTLTLRMDDDGLAVRAELDPTDIDVQYIVPKLRSGLIDEMSFAFRIDSGTWSPDFTEYRIDKVDIHRGDVAIVGYGANPHTDGTVRGSAGNDKARAMLALAVALG